MGKIVPNFSGRSQEDQKLYNIVHTGVHPLAGIFCVLFRERSHRIRVPCQLLFITLDHLSTT